MLNKISTQDLFNTIRSIRFSDHTHSLRLQSQHGPARAEFVSRMRNYENTNSARLQTETVTPGWLTNTRRGSFEFADKCTRLILARYSI